MSGINNISSQVAKLAGSGSSSSLGQSTSAATGDSKTSFSDILKDSINEVARLQQDASNAVQSVATGQTDDLASVMSAVEKSSIAFKTLLAIRGKLLDAYQEVRNMQI